MLTTPQPMEEDHARLEKPLARPREIISADSAEGSAATPNPPDPDDVTAQSQRGTPERPPRNRPRRAVVDDGPDAEDVAAQAALNGRADSKSNPPKEKSRATRSIRLNDDDDSETMADAPAALPGGELRVRPRHSQRTQTDSVSQTAYRALAIRHICAADRQLPARYVRHGNETYARTVGSTFVHPAVPDMWVPACDCIPLSSVPPFHWWDQTRTSTPTSPPATKSNHPGTSLAVISITLVLLVLMPSPIPHHSNNSTPGPCHTTPSQKVFPPLYSGARPPCKCATLKTYVFTTLYCVNSYVSVYTHDIR